MSRPDQLHGGTFNAHKNWKKLRDKHKRVKRGEEKWKPEAYRPASVTESEGNERIISKELYDLNYELAFGRITQEEYDKLREELGE
jgi:hypothetical protein